MSGVAAAVAADSPILKWHTTHSDYRRAFALALLHTARKNARGRIAGSTVVLMLHRTIPHVGARQQAAKIRLRSVST